jgi:hypothetical protein
MFNLLEFKCKNIKQIKVLNKAKLQFLKRFLFLFRLQATTKMSIFNLFIFIVVNIMLANGENNSYTIGRNGIYLNFILFLAKNIIS